MINFKNNKGITLYALIITVVVLILIAGTAAYTGMDVYQDAKKEALIQEMQIIQNAVNNEYSKIEAGDLSYVGYGEDLTRGEYFEDGVTLKNGYKKMTPEQLEENLGIIGLNQTVYINFLTKDVRTLTPIEEDKYTLYDLGEMNKIQSDEDLKKLYVLDGIIAMYDAIDKTDNGRIESKTIGNNLINGEIWADISGNKNDAKISSDNYLDNTWNENSLYLNKIRIYLKIQKYNQSINSYENIEIDVEESGITFNTAFKINTITTSSNGVYMPYCVTTGWIGPRMSDGIWFFYDREVYSNFFDLGTSFENGKTYSIDASRVLKEPTIVNKRIYLDGESLITSDVTKLNTLNTMITSEDTLQYNVQTPLEAEYYNIKIYARQLEDNEVKHNYYIDSIRYKYN